MLAVLGYPYLMKPAYQVMGINDDESYCSCCGKTGLKRVVWLATLDGDGNVDGQAVPFGTTCAAYLLRITPEKGIHASAAIERKIEAKLLETINTRISMLRKDWKQFDSGKGIMLVPADMDCTHLTGEQVYKLRNERFPILGYLNGTMTITEAAKWI